MKINNIIWEKVTITGPSEDKTWVIENCMVDIRDKFGSFKELVRGFTTDKTLFD